jgi:hypothetical protein
MSAWPREIADAEIIARGICSPYHVNKNGQLKPAAYRSPPDKDEVSTMRADWIGPHACEQHARNLENPLEKKVYKGLAILSAGEIRELGAIIIDSREEFEGHADIKHGIIQRRGEPLPPEQLKILRDREKALATLANYFADPDPQNVNWTGPALRYKT